MISNQYSVESGEWRVESGEWRVEGASRGAVTGTFFGVLTTDMGGGIVRHGR